MSAKKTAEQTAIEYDVNTLEGEMLDRAVRMRMHEAFKSVRKRWYGACGFLADDPFPENFSPSTNYEHARPVIELACIITTQLGANQWSAKIDFRQADIESTGPTELVAALRVYLLGISTHIRM